jgi:hypothetical protein
MASIEFQPWTTLQITAGGTLIQESDAWVDAGDATDAMFTVQVGRVTGTTLNLLLQTSVTEDDANFVTLTEMPLASSSVSIVLARLTDTTPILRFVRWKLSSADVGGTPGVTMRISAVFKGR